MRCLPGVCTQRLRVPYLIESFNWSRGPVTAGTCIQMRALIQERLVRHTSCCDRSAITILGVVAVVVRCLPGVCTQRLRVHPASLSHSIGPGAP